MRRKKLWLPRRGKYSEILHSCPCLICLANKYSWDIETLALDYCLEL